MKFWAIVIAILILLVMITVHEFGHYLAGKIFKFKINEFSIGMGPALIKKKKKNGEIFSVRLLPLGGYCAFEGEDEDKKEVENAFNSKKPWQRIIVLISGAFMNFLLALLVIIIMFSCYGETSYSAYEVKPDSGITYVLSDDDVILELNGKRIMLTTDFVKSLNGKKKGDVVKAKVLRSGKKQTIKVEMRENVNCKDVTDVSTVCKALGIATIAKISTKDAVYDASGSGFMDGDLLLKLKDFDGDYSQEKYDLSQRLYGKNELIGALREKNGKISVYVSNEKRSSLDSVNPTDKVKRYELNLDVSSLWASKSNEEITDQEILSALKIDSVDAYFRLTTVKYKGKFFTALGDSFVYSGKIGGVIFTTLGQLLTGKLGIKSVGGPVTTVVTTSKIVRMGLEYILQIVAFIGVNLAVFNLLPIPALDGSRVIFTLIEWIFKKPVPKKIEGIIHAVGLLILLGFSILVDVLQFL